MPVTAPQAGSLNRRLTLQQGTPGSTSEGDATLTWASLGNVWANVNPLGTQELLLAAQRGEDVTHQVTLRWRSNLPPVATLRLLYGNRIFFVAGASDPDEAHRSLVLRCKEYITTQTGAD